MAPTPLFLFLLGLLAVAVGGYFIFRIFRRFAYAALVFIILIIILSLGLTFTNDYLMLTTSDTLLVLTEGNNVQGAYNPGTENVHNNIRDLQESYEHQFADQPRRVFTFTPSIFDKSTIVLNNVTLEPDMLQALLNSATPRELYLQEYQEHNRVTRTDAESTIDELYPTDAAFKGALIKELYLQEGPGLLAEGLKKGTIIAYNTGKITFLHYLPPAIINLL